MTRGAYNRGHGHAPSNSGRPPGRLAQADVSQATPLTPTLSSPTQSRSTASPPKPATHYR